MVRGVICCALGHGEARRALLVGINDYLPEDPTVLSRKGGRHADERGAGHGGSPLSRLLSGVGAGSRSSEQPVPVNWSIERHVFVSKVK
jgi:hypothetical protein